MRELLDQKFAWFAAGLGLLCGLVSLRAGRAAGFIDDDIANLGFGKRYGFGSETFLGLAETRDHVLPGAAALNKLLSATGPDWIVAQLVAALLVAALVLALAMLIREITASPWLALFVGFLVGTSIVTGRIALWWTAASLQLPFLVLAPVLLLASLRWWRARASWLVAACVLLQLLAASFSDRAVLIPPLVWVVILTLPSDGKESFGRQIISRTKESCALLIGLFAVVIAQIGLTLVLASSNTKPVFATAGSLSVGGWLEVIANWWARGVAGVLTNDFPPPGFLEAGRVAIIDGQPVAVLAGGLAVTVTLALLTVRSRQAVFVWGALVLLVTVSGIQIAIGRVGALGPVGVATIPRYQDVTMLAVAVLVPLSWVVSGRPRPPVGALSALMIVAAVCAAWFVQLRAGVRESLDRPMAAASYARNLRSSLEKLSPGLERYSLLDDRIPEYVMGRVPQTASFSWLSAAVQVLAPGEQPPAFDGTQGTLLVAGPDGVVVPVRETFTLQVTRGKLGCVKTDVGSRWLKGSRQVRVPVSPRAVRSLRPIVLDVRLVASSARGEVGVTAFPETIPSRTLPLGSHPDGFRVVLPGGTPEAVIDFWGGARTCLERVSVSSATPVAE